MNHGSCTSGLLIIRCTSSGRSVVRLRYLTKGTPIDRFGTKWPSITSTCTASAPASSISATSRPMFMKSAERMDGAICTGSNIPPCFPVSAPTPARRPAGLPEANEGSRSAARLFRHSSASAHALRETMPSAPKNARRAARESESQARQARGKRKTMRV